MNIKCIRSHECLRQKMNGETNQRISIIMFVAQFHNNIAQLCVSASAALSLSLILFQFNFIIEIDVC